MQNEFFEWDDAKAELNLRTHKVAFEEACTVFDDVFIFTEEDGRESYGELRLNSIGMSCKGRLLSVIWTPRESRSRLISAFPPDKPQRKDYEKQRYRRCH